MRCSCCGNEIREDERYCNNCGQNNEGYVERKPIEKVEIYHQQPNSSTYTQPQSTHQQTNISTKYISNTKTKVRGIRNSCYNI